MTKYVLHGGRTSIDSKDNDLFFQQFTSLVDKSEVKILLCYWAREKERQEEIFQRDKLSILAQTNKKVVLHMVGDVKDLFAKLPDYDVLYVAGGEAEFIEPYLPKLGGLKKALEGKVFLGSSMGAFITSRYYVLSFDAQDDKSVHRGLGLIPFNTLCHWNAEDKKKQKIKLLQDKDPKTPILLLDEAKFSTIIFSR